MVHIKFNPIENGVYILVEVFFELAKDHWLGFCTRYAHMVHIVNSIRLKMVYISKMKCPVLFYLYCAVSFEKAGFIWCKYYWKYGQTLQKLRDGQLHTSLYDKRDDFNFHITNFPVMSSNVPSSPAYCVFISSDTPGLAPLWMFYSESDATFQ